jgi:uncharacterized protein
MDNWRTSTRGAAVRAPMTTMSLDWNSFPPGAALMGGALIGGLQDLHITATNGMLVIAGLLVGVGTRYGSGCTSWHGLCGLSRRSPRSRPATVVFMAMGFATVSAVRHVPGT